MVIKMYDCNYSEFDFDKHRATYKNYLEIIIDEDGNVSYATPSHQEKLISIICNKDGITRDQLNDQIPREYYLDVVSYLLIRSNCIAVWTDFEKHNVVNRKQIITMRRLKMYGLYKGVIPEEG